MKGESPEMLLESLPSAVVNRVHTVGHVTQHELHSLLAGAAVLAYPSHYEGFGLPPVEAMAAGVPVVASNTPAVAEVTAGAALLASPDDPDEWAAKFLLILSVFESAAQIIAAGRGRSALFTWERCARETAQIYKLVAGREVAHHHPAQRR